MSRWASPGNRASSVRPVEQWSREKPRLDPALSCAAHQACGVIEIAKSREQLRMGVKEMTVYRDVGNDAVIDQRALRQVAHQLHHPVVLPALVAEPVILD